MKKGTCVCFILFYIFRYYKRIDIATQRKELLEDMSKCRKLLKRMKKNIDPNISINIISSLLARINDWGGNMEIEYPIRYADYYDDSIVTLMMNVINDIISLVRHPLYKKYSADVFKSFMILHNLPRVLLDDASGDSSTPQNFHISKQFALDSFAVYFENTKKV